MGGVQINEPKIKNEMVKWNDGFTPPHIYIWIVDIVSDLEAYKFITDFFYINIA